MIRRTLLKAAGMAWVPGSVPAQRPDQLLQALSRSGTGPAPQSPFIVARIVIVRGPGAGIFTYDATGNLRTANVGQTTTDPIQGHTAYAGFSTFNGFGAVISLFSSTLDAQLWYADTGTSTQGALIASIATVAGTDPFGNAYIQGVASYTGTAAALFSRLGFGALALGSQNAGSLAHFAGGAQFDDALVASAQPDVRFFSPATTLGQRSTIWTLGESSDTTKPAQVVINTASSVTPTTTALLEVQGDVQAGDGLSIGQGAAVQTLVNGSTINTAGITMQPVSAAAAVTGIILQAGTFDGQVITIPSNAGVGNTATFAASGTSHVALGVAAVINPGACAVLVWVASTSLWYFAQ